MVPRISVVLVVLFTWCGSVLPAPAQELACRVQMNTSQLSGSDFDVLDDLGRRIQEYLNTTEWTDDEFLPHERVSCSMQIIVQEAVTPTTFNARLVVSTQRPIHGTTQTTRLVRVNDSDWRFDFSRGTALRYNLDRYDALTSVLDFYAYVMLGYDYDTFSKLGGTPYFERALEVADRAQSSGDPGWASVAGERNRNQLVSELQQTRHQSFRRALYKYHLEGLDRFADNPNAARESILNALEMMEDIRSNVTRSYVLDLFFSVKSDELTAIFQEPDWANRAYRLLTEIDPSRTSDYEALVQ